MRKLLRLFPLGALLLLPQALAAEPAGWLDRLDPALAEAKASNRDLLVELSAVWCGWCRQLEKKVFSTPRFADYAKKLVLLKVDVEDGKEGSRLQARYQTSALPTTLILDRDLVEIGSVEGYAETDEYIARIEGELARYAESRKRYDSQIASRDPAVLRALADELHRRRDGARAAEAYARLLSLGTGSPGDEAWLRYLEADAERLARRPEEAARLLAAARGAAVQRRDEELIEACDLLVIQIAQDRGDCGATVTALRSFLAAHPKSDLAPAAGRTLSSIVRDGAASCT